MGKSAHRKSFLIHTDSLEILDDLTDEQAGQLFKAIKDYQFGNEPKLSQLIKIAFNPFKNYFERDNEKWESEIDKRREAGRLGAEARWGKDNKKSQVMASDGKGIAKMASAISANSKMANMADSVSVSVSVNESVNVNESSIAISLPLNDNTEYDITDSLVDDYKELYQAVDIVQEIRKMKGWLMSNPSKRKTRRGVLRFVTNWLSREQDKGGASQKVNKPQSYADINSTIREQMVTPKLKAYTMEEIKKIRQDEQDEQQRLLNVH
jgi:hypothetical protein